MFIYLFIAFGVLRHSQEYLTYTTAADIMVGGNRAENKKHLSIRRLEHLEMNAQRLHWSQARGSLTSIQHWSSYMYDPGTSH